jgi:hypothetical protein
MNICCTIGTTQAANGWVASDRSVLYVVTDGAASDGGTDGDPLAVRSEQLVNIGIEVHVIGVGDRVNQYVFCFNVGRLDSDPALFPFACSHLFQNPAWNILVLC